MSSAKEMVSALLAGTDSNVSETAWAVGYVNVSHFGAAFKKRFGILLKQYLKMRRETMAAR